MFFCWGGGGGVCAVVVWGEDSDGCEQNFYLRV